jgi:hypothetical protein
MKRIIASLALAFCVASSWATTQVPAQLVGFTQSGTGALARTAQGKFQDVISIKDFGADATGATDSTTAIQSAINYALSLPHGAAVYMPAGTYKISATINIPFTTTVSFTLFGDGRATQLKYFGGSFPDLLSVGGATNLFDTQYVFRDFSFAQPNSGTATGANAALYLRNTNSALVQNVGCYNYSTCIALNASYNTRIIAPFIYGSSVAGIATRTTGTNSLYVDKGALNSNAIGISLGVGGNNIVIRDTDMEGNATAIAMANYTSVRIDGNYIELGTATAFNFTGTNNLVEIKQNWLGANSVPTTIANVVGGSFTGNTLYNSAWTFAATVSDVDPGNNLLLGTATLGANNFKAVPSFANNWTAGGSAPSYKKAMNGLVELRGAITAGTGSLGAAAFTLPAGYAPPINLEIVTITQANTVAVLYISSAGVVQIAVPGGAVGSVVSLDGVVFSAK